MNMVNQHFSLQDTKMIINHYDGFLPFIITVMSLIQTSEKSKQGIH